MTIREYIDKNLPNLNWNILPQIFEDEGVELTEEIEKYLKETPGNTNWNLFGSLGSGNGEDENLILDIMATFVGTGGPNIKVYNFTQPEQTLLLNKLKVGQSYKLTIDNYEEVGIWSYDNDTDRLYFDHENTDYIIVFQINTSNFNGVSIRESSKEECHIILEKVN